MITDDCPGLRGDNCPRCGNTADGPACPTCGSHFTRWLEHNPAGEAVWECCNCAATYTTSPT